MHSEPTSEATFEFVYKNELANLVRTATLILGSQSLAEEAVHDAFVQLHSKWFDVKNPGGFLQVAVVNRCKDLLRRRNVKERYLRVVQPEDRESQPDYELIAALQHIEYKRRAILVLRFYGQYKLAEIAELLDMPVGTVNSNLRRGIDELRKALS